MAPANPADGARTSVPDRRRSLAVLALLLVLVTAVQVAHVERYRRVSPVDELQHLDYLVRGPRGDLPGSGSRVLGESGRIETCARIDDIFDTKLQTCASSNEAVDIPLLQEEGYNTAYIHPPGYYVVDGVLARVIDAVVPGDQSLLTTGRLAGLLWSWAAVAFLWLLFAELRAGLVVRAALVLVVVTAPTLVHAAATINPDGSSVAIGAAALWVALRWERGRAPAWTLGLVGAVAAGTKVTNLLAVGLVALYLLWPVVVGLVRRDGRPAPAVPVGASVGGSGGPTPDPQAPSSSTGASDRRRRLVGLAWLLGPALLVAGVWAVAQRYLQVIPPDQVPMVIRFRAASFPAGELLGSVAQMLGPLQSPYLPPFLRTRGIELVADIVDKALLVGVVVGAVVSRRGSRGRRLAGCVVVLLVLVAPALVVFNYVVQGIYVVVPPRYGVALVPGMAAAAVPAVRTRIGGVVVVALATASVIALAWGLAFPLGR